jgi:hypothetical protein
MVKTFTILFLALLLISCGKSDGGGPSSSNGESVSLSEITPDSQVPTAAKNFEVNIKLNNFNSAQEDKILVASDLIKKVIASDEFKSAVLNYQYQGKKNFIDNDGLSNAQIYKKIIEGVEKLSPEIDNEMDLELVIYNANNSVVGYTLPNEIKIWMNAKFFDQNIPAKVTENMMHEWLHKLGFKHDYERTPTRPYSVPYAIGYLVGRIAQKLD